MCRVQGSLSMSNDRSTPRQQQLDPFASKVQQCQHPGCSTFSLHRLCARHRPLPAEGQWIVAQQVRDEIEQGER